MRTDYNNLPEQIDYLISEIKEVKEILSQRIGKPEEIPKFLSVEQLKHYLYQQGVLISKSKLYKMTSKDEIPCYKTGNRVYFSPEEIDNWLSAYLNQKSKTNSGFSGQDTIKDIMGSALFKKRKK